MNTALLPWQAFEPDELCLIEIEDSDVTLIYKNDTVVSLSFADQEQLTAFVGHLVTSLVFSRMPEDAVWN